MTATETKGTALITRASSGIGATYADRLAYAYAGNTRRGTASR
jgi:short-subunit dehydrogenase